MKNFEKRVLRLLKKNDKGLSVTEICNLLGITRYKFYVNYWKIKDKVRERRIGNVRLFYLK